MFRFLFFLLTLSCLFTTGTLGRGGDLKDQSSFKRLRGNVASHKERVMPQENSQNPFSAEGFLIHLGWPKCATSSFQRALKESTSWAKVPNPQKTFYSEACFFNRVWNELTAEESDDDQDLIPLL